MMFNEVAPYENLDLKCFRSVPDGRWEAGMLKMGWGKARVRIALAPAQSDGYVPVDYWGGDHKTAYILLGFLLAILTSLPESIAQHQIVEIFPEQDDKDMGPEFWRRLFLAATQVRTIWGDFQD